MSDQVQFDIGSEFEDKNYKSCFARSVAVNSQFRQTKSLDFKQLDQDNSKPDGVSRKPRVVSRPFTPEIQEVVRLRKNSRSGHEDTRRFSCSNINTKRSSMCSSRISEIPVENIVNHSKIETLQWQLKEIQKSREMYTAVMKQVVTFLEKAHHSLELLGSRMNRKNSVHRSKSEHQIMVENNKSHDSSSLSNRNKTLDDYSYKDFTWKQNKDDDLAPDEVPPDKLAQEAFRLLRTAQSLLNTREPDLCQLDHQPENDVEFIAQLAKEFPLAEQKPQRATSFCLSPKLILPEPDVRISTAFNRKLSLQLSEVKRYSKPYMNVDSARGSVAESDTEFINDVNVLSGQKCKSEKSNSPATGSISSVEDESGFSSMNSFQEVGLPLVNSTVEEVSTKSALLRSMIQNNGDSSFLSCTTEHSNITDTTTILSSTIFEKQDTEMKRNMNDIKLWQKPSSTPQHRRWYSSPVDEAGASSMKVLWV